jgi:hypothetical protein
MAKVIIWSIKELSDMAKQRVNNRFDCNIAVTGSTGIGKSTFLHHFFKNFRGFKIDEKLTYKRSEMIHLIKDFKNSYCWQDELIGSGFKRNFFEREQIELITVLTKYRNNYNIVGGAVPIFFTLDKELLKLFGIHIHIIKRGVGIVHLPREARMFTDDLWDTKVNAKLEEKWSNKIQNNPKFKIRYNRYTTFSGFVFFPPLKKKEEEYYEMLKETKREELEVNDKEELKKNNFYLKLFDMVKEKKLDKQQLINICNLNNKSFSSVKSRLNQMFQDDGNGQTLRNFLIVDRKKNDRDIIYKYNDRPTDIISNDDL